MTKHSAPDLTSRKDYSTAQAFASSWNTVFSKTPYTDEQVEDWLAPLDSTTVLGANILEMGCGSGGILHYVARLGPSMAVGIDLGDSVKAARENLAEFENTRILQDDLVNPEHLEQASFDLVYSIGVLHHLKEPRHGFASVLRHVKPGGRFHCWVYAREGNALVRFTVEPLRKITSRLPWWVGKYLFALPLAVPFFLYSKFCRLLANIFKEKTLTDTLPMFQYMLWIGKRGFAFHHHVAFDQLVTPQTAFLSRDTITEWLRDPAIDPESVYLILRNGNGWKFGGKTILPPAGSDQGKQHGR